MDMLSSPDHMSDATKHQLLSYLVLTNSWLCLSDSHSISGVFQVQYLHFVSLWDNSQSCPWKLFCAAVSVALPVFFTAHFSAFILLDRLLN